MQGEKPAWKVKKKKKLLLVLPDTARFRQKFCH